MRARPGGPFAALSLILAACVGTSASHPASGGSVGSPVPFSGPSATAASVATAAPSPSPGVLTIVRQVEVPSNGALVYAQGSLWVVARMFEELDRDSTEPPPGVMYEIDEASGAVVNTIDHVLGGFPAVGEGAIWLATLWGQQITRVDLETRTVQLFKTSDLAEYEPEAVVTTPGAVWVGNNWAGEVAKVDPETLQVIDRIEVSDGENIGPRGVAVSDGTSVWFPLSPSSEIVRIDARADHEVSRMDIGDGFLDALDLDGETLYAGPPGRLIKIDVRDIGSERIVADAPISGILLLAHGFGSLWVLRSATGNLADAEVLRVDPATLAIQARLPLADRLTSADTATSFAPGLVVGDEGIWIRAQGKILEIAPR